MIITSHMQKLIQIYPCLLKLSCKQDNILKIDDFSTKNKDFPPKPLLQIFPCKNPSKIMITRKNCFRYLNLVSPFNAMARTRKYYLKNNYLTLRSKDKVPRRVLRYATNHLLVMHPHTKYNWLIWKDKKVMFRTSFAEKKRKKKWKKNQTKTICLPSFEGET
jgi:hypothetical protein